MNNTTPRLRSSVTRSMFNENQQRLAFEKYINHSIKYEKPIVENLYTSLCDGTILIRFIENETITTFQKKYLNPKNTYEKIENLSIVLNYLKSDNCIITASAEEILNGEKKAIMALVYQLISKYRLFDRSLKIKTSDFKIWFESILNCPFNDYFDVQNCISNPSYFAQLINSISPNTISENDLTGDPINQLQYCFTIAETALNIPSLLDPVCLLNNTIDEFCLYIYLTYFITNDTNVITNEQLKFIKSSINESNRKKRDETRKKLLTKTNELQQLLYEFQTTHKKKLKESIDSNINEWNSIIETILSQYQDVSMIDMTEKQHEKYLVEISEQMDKIEEIQQSFQRLRNAEKRTSKQIQLKELKVLQREDNISPILKCLESSQETNQIYSKIESIQDELNNYKTENNQLSDQLKSITNKFNDLSSLHSNIENELVYIKDEKIQFGQQINDLKHENGLLQTSLTEKNSQLQNLLTHLPCLNHQVFSNETLKDDDIINITKQLQCIVNENNELKKENIESKETIQNLESSINQKQIEIQTYTVQINSIKDEYEQKENNLNLTISENKNYINQLKELQQHHLSQLENYKQNQQINIDSSLTEHIPKVIDLQTQLNNIHDEMNIICSKLQTERNDNNKLREQLQQVIEESSTKVTTFENQIKELTICLEEKESKIKHITNDSDQVVNDLHKKIKEEEEQHQTIINDLSLKQKEYEQKYTTISNELLQEKDHIEQLNKKLIESELQFNSLQKDYQVSKDQLIESHDQKLKTQELKNSQLINDVNDLKELVEERNSKISLQYQEIQQLSLVVKEKQTKIDDLQQVNDNLELLQNSTCLERNEIQNQLTSQVILTKELNEKYKELTSVHLQDKESNITLQENIKDIQLKWKTEIEVKSKAINEKQKEIEVLNESNEDLNAQLSQMNDVLTTKSNDLQHLNEEHQRVLLNSNKEKESIQQIINTLENTTNELKQQLKSQQHEFQIQFKQQKNEHEEELQNYCKEVQQLQKEIKQIQETKKEVIPKQDIEKYYVTEQSRMEIFNKLAVATKMIMKENSNNISIKRLYEDCEKCGTPISGWSSYLFNKLCKDTSMWDC
ncbi:hypothetical protein QTN25_000621 [Entamoeba marina]